MPNLKFHRRRAAGCALGDHIYAFGGQGVNKRRLVSSIERLNVAETLEAGEETTSWELIEISQSDLRPRMNAIISPINSRQLVIIGGQSGVLYYDSVHVFDTETKTVRTVASGRQCETAPSPGSQTTLVRNGKILAFVSSLQYPPRIIQYSEGHSFVVTIEELPK